jgi:hypothetical protein
LPQLKKNARVKAMVFGKLHQTVTESEPVQKIKVELYSEEIRKLIKNGFYTGLGWAAGVTIGFALVSTIVVVVLNRLGGIPIVGGFLAEIVSATTDQLSGRTPVSATHKVSATPEPTVTIEPTATIQLTPTETVLQ